MYQDWNTAMEGIGKEIENIGNLLRFCENTESVVELADRLEVLTMNLHIQVQNRPVRT